jgi:hypothetical protein
MKIILIVVGCLLSSNIFAFGQLTRCCHKAPASQVVTQCCSECLFRWQCANEKSTNQEFCANRFCAQNSKSMPENRWTVDPQNYKLRRAPALEFIQNLQIIENPNEEDSDTLDSIIGETDIKTYSEERKKPSEGSKIKEKIFRLILKKVFRKKRLSRKRFQQVQPQKCEIPFVVLYP